MCWWCDLRNISGIWDTHTHTASMSLCRTTDLIIRMRAVLPIIFHLDNSCSPVTTRKNALNNMYSCSDSSSSAVKTAPVRPGRMSEWITTCYCCRNAAMNSKEAFSDICFHTNVRSSVQDSSVIELNNKWMLVVMLCQDSWLLSTQMDFVVTRLCYSNSCLYTNSAPCRRSKESKFVQWLKGENEGWDEAFERLFCDSFTCPWILFVWPVYACSVW